MLDFILRFLYSRKFIFLLVVGLNTPDFVDYMKTLKVDESTIDSLFTNSFTKNCRDLLNNLERDEDANTQNIISNLIAKFGSHRKILMLRSKISGAKIIAKHNMRSFKLLRELAVPLSRGDARRDYLLQSLQSDVNFCPEQSIQQFIDFFTVHSEHNETTVWLLLLADPQVVIHSYLEHNGFPVPHLYGICGLTIFQEHVGQTLQHFYKAEFAIKLRIGMLLLESALKFTNGFEGYRVYITDITADNLIYNEERDKLYFIDLNTVYIVNSKMTLYNDDIDQHDNIECDDCFAFVPNLLCTYGISDLNLLESCRFLREDLKRDLTKGFLKPIPEKIRARYPDLEMLLDNCVNGEVKTETESIKGMSRFHATLKLIELFSNILNDFF